MWLFVESGIFEAWQTACSSCGAGMIQPRRQRLFAKLTLNPNPGIFRVPVDRLRLVLVASKCIDARHGKILSLHSAPSM